MTAALEGGEWSAARPGRTLPPGKDRVPILHEARWAPGPVWTGGKSFPHRDSIPDRPARSQSLIIAVLVKKFPRVLSYGWNINILCALMCFEDYCLFLVFKYYTKKKKYLSFLLESVGIMVF